jgi:hypothetical protein
MKNLFKALAEFQQEVPVIHKGTKGYGYTYADLPAIFETINPLLKKHGLGFTQLVEGTSIKTIVFHCESGETLESLTDIPQGVQLKGMNDFQVLGSAITYIRRYALSSALGLVTDKDTDAGGEQTPNNTPTASKAPNIQTVSNDDINRVSKALSEVDEIEALSELFKKETLKNVPQIKQLFTRKKIELEKLQTV